MLIAGHPADAAFSEDVLKMQGILKISKKLQFVLSVHVRESHVPMFKQKNISYIGTKNIIHPSKHTHLKKILKNMYNSIYVEHFDN